MNPDSNELPDFILADLFKDTLVVLDNEAVKHPGKENSIVVPAVKASKEKVVPGEKELPVKPLQYLGNNQKHISIVVNDAVAIHLQEDLLEMLSAILTACRLNLADVAIINIHQQRVSDELLRTYLSPQTVLLFGISTSMIGLPFSIPDYKVQSYNNCIYLQAVALENMNGKTDDARLEKSKLWVCLKTIFGV